MSAILTEIKKKGILECRIKTELIEELIAKFLLKNYDVRGLLGEEAKEFENDKDLEEFLSDEIILFTNDNNDVAIDLGDLDSLEDVLRNDNLITEGNDFRATNLCCKAIADELDCNKKLVDIWATSSCKYLRIQIPVEVVK